MTPEWQERAACRSLLPSQADWFFDRRSWPWARKVCAVCPVRTQCLDELWDERWALVGGLSPEERGFDSRK